MNLEKVEIARSEALLHLDQAVTEVSNAIELSDNNDDYNFYNEMRLILLQAKSTLIKGSKGRYNG